MFQSFESTSSPDLSQTRVADVRALMAAAKIDCLLVPRADEHQGEYVPACADRLRWLTGFSGSAGLAVIGTKTAAVFVDGRYTVQVKAECDPKIFEFQDFKWEAVAGWISEKLPRGGVVGFDPWLHTIAVTTKLEGLLKPKGIKLKALPKNLIDKAWGDERPEPPQQPVIIHSQRYAGKTGEEKLLDVQKRLATDGQDAVVLTLPDSIAWLFNIRGSDIPHNPVALAFAIVPAKGKPEIFIDGAKLEKEVRAHLAAVAKVSVPAALKDRVTALKKNKKTVRLDSGSAAVWFARTLGPKGYRTGSDPCVALKAVKNKVEIAGARSAHVRDGAALVRYLAWLDREAPKGTIDEIEAVSQLEIERSKTQALKEISFDTISGSGANGAIVHYRVSRRTNRKLKGGELFLLDSGAQYLDGTTDVTRTIAIGSPTREMCERFTRVLKGHIGVATAVFPKGTRGIDLDPFARRALWEAGLDYDHGTGHGVGSYLSVHEGPQSISRAGMVPLEPGMIISNEPGYYKEGAYGIRIENLVLVKTPVKPSGGDREMMAFETLTLVPIDRRLVVAEFLSREELAWLNAYHAAVRDVIGREVDPETRAWLEQATAEIK